METFYDLGTKCWFLKVNGMIGYVPDPDLVWDASLDKVLIMHNNHIPGQESNEELQSKLAKLKVLHLKVA